MTLILLALACDPATPKNQTPDDTGGTEPSDGGGVDDGGGTEPTDGGTETVPPPVPSLGAVGGSQVLDPLRGSPGAWSAEIADWTEGLTVDLVLRDAVGEPLATLAEDLSVGPDAVLDFTWDLRDGEGLALPTGSYSLEWTLSDSEGEAIDLLDAPFQVVRTGLLTGQWGGSGGADDVRVPLLWHQASGASSTWDDAADEPAFQLDAILTGSGADELPTQVSAVWESLRTPPTGWTDTNLPQGYAYDSRPTLRFTLGSELGDTASLLWEARIEGWELVAGSVAEGTLSFRKTEALAERLSVVEGDLSVELRVEGELVSTQAVPYRVYAIMGPATFSAESAPHLAWVEAIDGALRGMAEADPTDEAVLDALIEWIFLDLGLRYDTRSGASYYMSYSGWSSGRFSFSSFLDRANGSTINCSDCSGIAGVYANMLGIPLDYTIILSNFQLNQIEGIGVGSFSNCPFGGGGCGFSYHAVTTNNDAESIWDATLALDGDDDPGSSPSTRLFVQDIDGDEYLDRLVMSGSASYYYSDSRVRIR